MYSVNDCKVVELPIVHNESGNITVLENGANIPFDIKRIYYLYDVPMDTERGGHAHYDLNQYIIAASGSFRVLLDDCINQKEVFLNRPDRALHIVPGIWREIRDFSSGSICLVLASTIYSEEDYIRNYDDLKAFRNEGSVF
ncbi:sugar 3,4-ketoisomerase [Niabella beijingensis]|uniref:sugar 3,4-ketoisomerase n=1 Tax=Niabella beijingensis TaxID=2872700 RepID=UPI001CBCE092|nr:FdtA/QdtA family cupin domain-containing protein [Niabella beijingensis]MBZ4189994.1 FdtA/QdtA family cupin domain-containing protein [Niabella beijingensis]